MLGSIWALLTALPCLARSVSEGMFYGILHTRRTPSHPRSLSSRKASSACRLRRRFYRRLFCFLACFRVRSFLFFVRHSLQVSAVCHAWCGQLSGSFNSWSTCVVVSFGLNENRRIFPSHLWHESHVKFLRNVGEKRRLPVVCCPNACDKHINPALHTWHAARSSAVIPFPN